MFAALENLGGSGKINEAGENSTENIKISAKDIPGLYERNHHKPRFDEECSNLYIKGMVTESRPN